MTRMEKLKIVWAPQPTTLGFLSGMTRLRELDIFWPELTDVSAIAKLSALETLSLFGCGKVEVKPKRDRMQGVRVKNYRKKVAEHYG